MVELQKGLLLGFSLILLSGCGNAPTDKNSMLSNTTPHKISRGEDINTLANDVHAEIGNDDKNYIFKYSSPTPHMQIYLDTDKNEQSGYRPWVDEGVGAEYVIEDNRIYKYLGTGRDWSWERMPDISTGANKYYGTLPLEYFGENVTSFITQTMAIDENWETVYTKDEGVVTQVINLNGNLKVLETEHVNLSIGDDALNYYISYDNTKNAPHNQVYIDTDNSLLSGYNTDHVDKDKGIGAEYLIEDNRLYEYTGSGLQTDWTWKLIQKISLVDDGDGKRYFILPKKEIIQWDGNSTIVAMGYDKKWEERLYETYKKAYYAGKPPSNYQPPKKKHILGPKHGEELSIYHAKLVMKILRTLYFSNNSFVGLSLGSAPSGIPYGHPFSSQEEIFSGVPMNCESGKDFDGNGRRTISWHNDSINPPTNYTSTRTYDDCNQGGLNFGDFYIYDGYVSQSGTDTTGGYPHAIDGGNIDAKIKLSNKRREISATFDGYIKFDNNRNKLYTQEIIEVNLDIYHKDISSERSGPYEEKIAIGNTEITFEKLVIEKEDSISLHHGIKNLKMKLSVENNNHESITLLVTSVPPKDNNVFWSIKIQRGELSDDPSPTQHSIRIDRLDEVRALYNVYIDFNKNGKIDDHIYPRERYENETLYDNKWKIKGL